MSIQVTQRFPSSVGNDSSDEISINEATPILSKEIQIVPKVSAPSSGSGWFGSAFLVVNAALGAGLLNFPLAYHQAGGILIAIVMQSIFLIFVVAAIMILGYCSDIKGTNNYQDVVHSVCGPWAQIACAVSITLYCFGTCITFLIIIGDQWEMCEFFWFISIAFLKYMAGPLVTSERDTPCPIPSYCPLVRCNRHQSSITQLLLGLPVAKTLKGLIVSKLYLSYVYKTWVQMTGKCAWAHSFLNQYISVKKAGV